MYCENYIERKNSFAQNNFIFGTLVKQQLLTQDNKITVW